MAITVPFDLAYEFDVNAPAAEVFSVLADVPTSAGFFPKVSALVDLGGGVYRWELEKVGTAAVNIQTIYAAKYVANQKKGLVVWTPVPGVGNAQISGSWTVTDKKKFSQIVLKLEGEIHLPLPGLMTRVVAPLVTSENEKLVEQYIANLIQRFGGEH
jgi:carbon monoxide dehydrogenase subunit G